MQKQIYVDLAHQMVTGGDITDENQVWREDIEALLPAAVNYALVGGMFDQSNQEHDRDIPGTFVVPILNVALTQINDQAYFTMPQNIIPLASDRGIRMITSPSGDHVYGKMNDNFYATWNYYKQIIKERLYRIYGTTVTLYNKPVLETACNLYIISAIENYTDTQDLPVPAGKEIIVVQQLFQMFMKQQAESEHHIQYKTDLNQK